MKKAPLILISSSTEQKGKEFSDFSLSLSMNYPLAAHAGGGTPWIVPCITEADYVAECVRRADGVMLTGGDDIAPDIYRDTLPGSLKKTVYAASPERDLFELMVVAEVFRQRKPLLAICRGHQLLNVALGGDLIVDISQQVKGAINHSRSDKKSQVVHDVRVEIGSLLAQTAGGSILGVNSSHHQAVAKIAKPLRATAVSIDGIIEGLELAPGHRHLLPYLLAVQFHPERLFARHAQHLELFKSFVSACYRHRRN